MSRCTITLLSWLTILLGGCDEPFDPIQPSDLIFSIHGHLEATAQRQWVRVMPIRSSLLTSPGPIDAVVTLEEVETGSRVVMTDSLVRYLPVNLGDTAVYAHNFTTTMRLSPGRHYRLTATRSDGAQATATVLIPVVENPRLAPGPGFGRLVLGVPHLAMALAVYDLGDPCPLTSPTFEEFLPVLSYGGSDGDSPVIEFSWRESHFRPWYIPRPPPECSPVRRSTRIIASGAPWPWRYDRSSSQPASPGSASNIEGGLGFLAGVHTVTL